MAKRSISIGWFKRYAVQYLDVQCGRRTTWPGTALRPVKLVVPSAEGGILPAAHGLPILSVKEDDATVTTLYEYLHFGFALDVFAVSVPV